MTVKTEKPLPALEIFRFRDGISLAEADMIDMSDPSIARNAANMKALAAEGSMDGAVLNVLFRRPGGMSLVHCWFKSGYPLPSHSHSTPCLYYIVAGSLTMGSQVLGPGDGFYLEPDAPYLYTPGPEGVEVLEFRDTDHFDTKFKDRRESWWQRAVEGLKVSRKAWPEEVMPSGMPKA